MEPNSNNSNMNPTKCRNCQVSFGNDVVSSPARICDCSEICIRCVFTQIIQHDVHTCCKCNKTLECAHLFDKMTDLKFCYYYSDGEESDEEGDEFLDKPAVWHTTRWQNDHNSIEINVVD